jgi:hypothetical protein
MRFFCRVAGRGGCRSLVVVAGDFESDRLAEHLFERTDVPVRSPQLELGVAAGAEASQVVVAPRIDVDAR